MIGPVKLALVVTPDAKVAVAALPPILKLATGVVDVTTNGAVPVAIVDVNCVPENPVAVKIPVEGTKLSFVDDTVWGRFPVFAVTQVGYTVAAVAISLLMAVLVAFKAVVAVAAFPPILKLATGVVEVTTKGAVPVAIVDVNCVPDKVPVAATEVGVIAPRVNVIAGVVVGVATAPETPLAVVTDTLVTVPTVGVLHIGANVVPCEVNTCPADPLANNAVVFTADW